MKDIKKGAIAYACGWDSDISDRTAYFALHSYIKRDKNDRNAYLYYWWVYHQIHDLSSEVISDLPEYLSRRYFYLLGRKQEKYSEKYYLLHYAVSKFWTLVKRWLFTGREGITIYKNWHDSPDNIMSEVRSHEIMRACYNDPNEYSEDTWDDGEIHREYSKRIDGIMYLLEIHEHSLRAEPLWGVKLTEL